MWTSIHWRRSHQRKLLPFSESRGETFFLNIQGPDGADQENLKPRHCQQSPRTFGSSWYRSRNPHCCPRLTPNLSLRLLCIGRQALKTEKSALVSFDIRLWVQGQPLPIWWSSPQRSQSPPDVISSNGYVDPGKNCWPHKHGIDLFRWHLVTLRCMFLFPIDVVLPHPM